MRQIKNRIWNQELWSGFTRTVFWNKEKDRIEFIPQFKIGEYIKQLDSSYRHPSYVVDFFLIYRDEHHEEHKVILEYDGFSEHFKNQDGINSFNYEYYYSDEDVYRQKVLESYGYKFLRLNRFNLGKNPISTIDDKIYEIIRPNRRDNNVLRNIYNTVESLQNGNMKECPKCKEIRNTSDFKDSSLVTGYGRFCIHCKKISRKQDVKNQPQPQKISIVENRICPKCGSGMVIRSGRYGKFYGCSKYPRCKATRQYNSNN